MRIKVGLVSGEEHVWVLEHEGDRWEANESGGLTIYDRLVALYPPGVWLSMRIEYDAPSEREQVI